MTEQHEPAEVSRRLKAARWLMGGTDSKGKPVPLAPEDLAQMEPLARNGITANAITEIERLIRKARPMELQQIVEAIGLPPWWFDAPFVGRDPATGTAPWPETDEPVSSQELYRAVDQVLEALSRAGVQTPTPSDVEADTDLEQIVGEHEPADATSGLDAPAGRRGE